MAGLESVSVTRGMDYSGVLTISGTNCLASNRNKSLRPRLTIKTLTWGLVGERRNKIITIRKRVTMMTTAVGGVDSLYNDDIYVKPINTNTGC